MKQYHDQHVKSQDFSVGDAILACDYTKSSEKWKLATVVDKSVPLSHEVQIDDSNLVWPRHATNFQVIVNQQ